MKKVAGIPITGLDIIQIVINIIAFVILFLSLGGHGSFWSFLTFNIIAGIILTESVLSKDKTGFWVWITKTFTYILLVINFASNRGELKWWYIVMILISVTALVISRYYIKKRAVSFIGQDIAYAIGGIMYVIVIYHNPEQFGMGHICFWLVNSLSYFLVIHDIFKNNRPKVNLIIHIFAAVTCLIYVAFIIAFTW